MRDFTRPGRGANPWMQAPDVNQRFDKVGNLLPLERHGCGCGLCARPRRAHRHPWEAR